MGDETGCSGDRLEAEDTRRAALLRQITEEGGFAFVSSVEKAAAGDLRAAEAAREMAWEQLHSGPWHEVVPEWRDAYAMACLHVAEIKSSGGERREALRALDMGLIMGGPLLRAELDAAIERIGSGPSDGQEAPANTGSGLGSDSGADAQKWEESLCTYKEPQEALRNLPSKSLSGKRVERRAMISFETFISDYFLRQIPVIITGCMDQWPACTKWKDINYLKQIAGDRTVPVEVGKNYVCTDWKQELITFSQFLDRIGSHKCPESTTYLAQHPLFNQIRQLKEDILVPDYCYAGGGELKSLNAWFGPIGTVTPLHHDPHHNIFAQVVGRKYIRLYPSSLSDELYPHDESMLFNTSQVDLDHIDTKAFPKIENLEFMDCILDQGEMLYIPPKWWHYVRSLSTSFSVSFWWSAATSNDK
ncbi:2-oxoglutarate (2OG) and Fe(II)-dependent oxygenase superfamily protein [Rhynchospora pubera]|uniref:2-oxoglutarate (2OG) and Fe(II)-dependent oxygenase superfamily protein n=1 Tax=Rhynchospora pubera TaxID=906938 RepID=A0AAV8G1T6_9POAL|nr:2-oxoglutarate (2OG) and Fe(II)-dependent oxygenase superfamily protein [Rhynchospora pubera]